MASPFGLSFPKVNLSPSNPALLPLMSTPASVSVAIYEAIVFNGLIKASQQDRHSTARTLSLWWKTTLPQGLGLILSLGLASTIGGVRTIRALRNGSREKYVAIAGTMFAVGHFLFGPGVARVIQGMAEAYDDLGGIEAKEEGRSEVVDGRVVELQRQWLRIHVWRSLVVDAPAMVCFAWLAAMGG